VAKLATAQLNREVTSLCVDLLGAGGTLYGSYEPDGHDLTDAASYDSPMQAFLRARANTIEGGTSEVLRNILGERILGLAGDVRVDKALPWSQVPRS
jgi:alkylation response protein AidB-like acyl-CoA dehydrogenase